MSYTKRLFLGGGVIGNFFPFFFFPSWHIFYFFKKPVDTHGLCGFFSFLFKNKQTIKSMVAEA